MKNNIDELCINTIRTLAMDAVQQANSGHPGMPMGAAGMAYVLWTRFLKHNPANPAWRNRDRFVLSAGHGSMLLYSLLHLTGYDLSLEDIKNFRQLDSRTPGHPEYGLTPGVECTTGPLGQGVGMGVGMAIAERYLAAMFNKPDFPIVDHYTYGIISDGDLMEGISHEAASLAGHLGLGKLIYLYDDNRISIEGDTALAFSEDIPKRFEAYGWHVQEIKDDSDLAAIAGAIRNAQQATERPSLIKVCTHIAFGSPNKQDTAASHGSPLGAEEIVLTKKALGWPADKSFSVPDEALAVFRQALAAGQRDETAWEDLYRRYREAYPLAARQFEEVMAGQLAEGWENALPAFQPEDGSIATRVASGKVINALAAVLPNLIGGSADLAPSVNTEQKGAGDFSAANLAGRNLRFGVREFGMGVLLNGLALHGGIIPYGGTFLVFSDYMRPAVRLGALMGLPVVYIWTHDSVWLGEDGPTHQPVEHLAALRAIPNLAVFRPADANETVAAWKYALTNRQGPTALALTRQGLPVLAGTAGAPVERGAYILADTEGLPDVILIATGSEVPLALESARELQTAHSIRARVVSMPCRELFDAQPREYRHAVLPPACGDRLSIEAGIALGWEKYVGEHGDIVSIDRFGASAPQRDLECYFGFTVAQVVLRVRRLLDDGADCCTG